MPNNRIDAVLSAQALEAILGAVNTIREQMPFLLDLTPDERRVLPKMGDKSRAFVSKALEVAIQTPEILPRGYDLATFRRDVDLAAALQPVAVALAKLSEEVDDTHLLVRSEAYTGALMVYQYARAHGHGAALDELADELGRRFGRRPRDEFELEIEPPAPSA
jgi:hypothetical protein